MIRINYQSDFAVRVTLKDATGTAVAPPTGYPWYIHFTDAAGTCWKCGFDGTSYDDCAIDGDAIVCCVDNPGFIPGALTVTWRDDVPAQGYHDGSERHVIPVTGAIYLWTGATDGSGEVDMEMVISIVAPQITDAHVDTAGDLNLVINYSTQHIHGNND